jgi:recombination protein RecR
VIYPSKLIEEAVNQISKMPGIGKKSALRIALHLLKTESAFTEKLAASLSDLRLKTVYCKNCHAIADHDLCQVCSSVKRETKMLAIVQDTRDMMAIENTSQYMGYYHVLGGVISPIQGIGPKELNIDSLIQRIKQNPEIQELILALSPTMEGDTTAFYIKKQLADFPLKFSTIARGIPLGSDLEYTDEITLGRSIISRVDM